METEMIDKLYLELGQFTSVRPPQENGAAVELANLKGKITDLLPHSAECLLTDEDGGVILDSDNRPIFLNYPCNCPQNIQEIRNLIS